ncbi:hypothetical protein [Vibrio phage LV6]|nr:hypothetical protein [Vibrio phage LV6]
MNKELQWVFDLKVGDTVAINRTVAMDVSRGWSRLNLYSKTFETHHTVEKVKSTQLTLSNGHRYLRKGYRAGCVIGTTDSHAISKVTTEDQTKEAIKYQQKIKDLSRRRELASAVSYDLTTLPNLDDYEKAVEVMESHVKAMREVIQGALNGQ